MNDCCSSTLSLSLAPFSMNSLLFIVSVAFLCFVAKGNDDFNIIPYRINDQTDELNRVTRSTISGYCDANQTVIFEYDTNSHTL